MLEELEPRETPSATVAASSYFDSAIYEFDSGSGKLLATLIAPNSSALLSGPSGLTIGPDRNLYISSQLNNAILKYDLSTNTLSTFISSAVLGPIATANGDTVFAPAGLRFGTDGDLYVSLNGGQSASSGGAVVRFGINYGAHSLTFAGTDTTVATGLIQPTGLTFGTAAGDTNSLYVSNSGVGNVFQIANATSVTPTSNIFISAGSGGLNYPSGLTWGPDGKLDVVDLGATSFQGNVLQYNANGTFFQTLTPSSGSGDLLFQFPSDIVFDGNGHFLTGNLGPSYPPNLTGSINQYNLNGTFSQTLVSSSQFPNTGPGASGVSPSQLAILPSEPIVAASFFDSSIYEFDSITGALTATLVAPYTSALLSGPAGISVGPDGNLYISSQFNNSILQYNTTTGALSTFISSAVLGPIATANGVAQFAPSGLRFGPDGNLYVNLNGGQSAFSGGAVIRFGITSTGGVLSYSNTNTTVAAGLIQPTGLTFGAAAGDTGNLYVSNIGAGDVVKVTGATGGSPSSSTFVAPGSGGLNYPAGLSFNVNGKLEVVDLGATSNQGNVLQFNANGSFDKVLTPSTGAGDLLFQFPSDVLFDGQGHFLTANLGPSYPPSLAGSVNQYDSDGNFNQTLVSSSQFPNTGPGTSGVATSQLAVAPPDFTLHIASNPTDTIVGVGASTSFTAAASDDNSSPITVKWQISTNGGGSFSDLSNGGFYSGVTTTTLNITGATLAVDGNQYRAVFNNSLAVPVTTAAATLAVDFAPTVSTNPTNATVNAGANTSFTAAATNGKPAATTVKWQISTNGGASFSDLSNGGIYSNVTTTTLNISGATASLNGDQYRAVFNNAANLPANTTAATLTVDFAPTVSTNPSNATVNAGANASFTAAATNGNPTPTTVKWQISTNGGASFSDLGNGGIYSNVTTTTLNIAAATATLNGNEYRAVFNNSANLPATTTAATLTVNFAPNVTTNPANATANAGANTSFTAAAAAGNPTLTTVKWQVSINGGATFSDLTNGGVYSGVTTTTLTITAATASLNSHEYRAVFNNSANLPATTMAATLTVDFAPTVSTNPTNQTANVGGNISFTAAATDGNPTPTSVKWQISTNGGVSFSDLSNGGIYSNVTTTTLNITGATASLNGDKYRAVFSNTASLSSNTTAATITIASYAAADFAGYGVFLYTAAAGWQPLHSSTDASLVGVDASANVIAEFPGYGLYRYAGGVWTSLHTADADQLSVSANGMAAVNFPGYGVYRFTPPTGFQQFNGTNATHLGIDGSGNIVADFKGYGVYRLASPTSATQLSKADVTTLAVDSLGGVIADFQGYGVNRFVSGTTWTQLSKVDATALAVNSSGKVVALFPGYSLNYFISGTTWSQLPMGDTSVFAMDISGNVLADFPPNGVQLFTTSWGVQTPANAYLLATSQG